MEIIIAQIISLNDSKRPFFYPTIWCLFINAICIHSKLCISVSVRKFDIKPPIDVIITSALTLSPHSLPPHRPSAFDYLLKGHPALPRRVAVLSTQLWRHWEGKGKAQMKLTITDKFLCLTSYYCTTRIFTREHALSSSEHVPTCSSGRNDYSDLVRISSQQ